MAAYKTRSALPSSFPLPSTQPPDPFTLPYRPRNDRQVTNQILTSSTITIATTTAMSKEELSVPYWLPRLQGKSNWAEWRKNVEEATYEIEETAAYWGIIMDREGDVTQHDAEEPSPPKSPINPHAAHCQDAPEDDNELFVTGPSTMQGPSGKDKSGRKVYNRRILKIRARQILASSLDFAPKLAIDRNPDAHEAYLKLESLYGDTSAQSIFVTWEKLLKVRYLNRGLPCDKFVDRFKNALQDVKDQAVEVSPTVSLALFQQAIKSHSNTTNFMANMKANIYEPDFMDTIYKQFLKEHAVSDLRLPETILGSIY